MKIILWYAQMHIRISNIVSQPALRLKKKNRTKFQILNKYFSVPTNSRYHAGPVKPVRSQFKRISIKANSCVNIEDCSPILHQIKSDMFWLQIHDYCPILRFNILVMASRQISVLFPSIPFGKWQNNTKSQTNNKWFIHSNLCVIEIRLFGIMCHTSWCLLCTSFVCDARICLIYSRI